MQSDRPDFDGVALDRITIAQEFLDIQNKHRSNSFPWNGQFSPQLIEILLKTYAPKQGVVLDPFAGSGTVLHEAASLRLPVFGADINPAACKVAWIYCLMNLPLAQRKRLAAQLEHALHERIPVQTPSLFSTNGPVLVEQIKESLLAIHGGLREDTLKSMLEALVVLMDFHHEASEEKVYRTWNKLKKKILSLPESESSIRLVNCDARRLPLQDDEADFAITSPPYINVFNYHQQYRRSLEALGWDLLAVARSEIGSNRKHRQNRFLTVIQYCLDMTDSLRELQRVCKEDAHILVIVGRESNVRKTRFFNGEIMAALATHGVGFAFVSRQERCFVNRFGEQIVEDLLHFKVRKNGNGRTTEPRTLARQILEKVRRRTPLESLSDLDDAINRVDDVPPSPLYDRKIAGSPSWDREGKGNEI